MFFQQHRDVSKKASQCFTEGIAMNFFPFASPVKMRQPYYNISRFFSIFAGINVIAL
jgi:hypothetical protein